MTTQLSHTLYGLDVVTGGNEHIKGLGNLMSYA